MTCRVGQGPSFTYDFDMYVLIAVAAITITLLHECFLGNCNGRVSNFLCANALRVDMIAKGTLALFL